MSERDETTDSEADPAEADPAEADPAEADAPAAAEAPERAGSAAWLAPIGVTLAATAALSFAFLPEHAGQPRMLLTVGATYGVLLVGTCIWLARRGELERRLAPRRGDITFGALLAVGTYMLALLAHFALTGRGSPREPWIMRVYLQVGDPRLTATFLVGLAVLAIAAAEEVVWRGWVMGGLRLRLSGRNAWLVSTALYAAAHLPTVYLLRDPVVGLNPLLLVASAGGGLVWGYLALKLDRLGPSVFAHALLSWALIEYPVWRM